MKRYRISYTDSEGVQIRYSIEITRENARRYVVNLVKHGKFEDGTKYDTYRLSGKVFTTFNAAYLAAQKKLLDEEDFRL